MKSAFWNLEVSRLSDSGRLFFSFNKREDWENGLMSNLMIDGSRLLIRQAGNEKGVLSRGVFYSCALDSREDDFDWFRMTSEFHIPEDTYVKISYYASNLKTLMFDGQIMEIDTFLSESSIGMDRKKQTLDALFQKTVTNASDVLMEACGRYLWIRVELLASGRLMPSISKIRIYFRGEEIIHYLPAIYREGLDRNAFFRRFMALFQSFFFDLEDRIYSVSRFFDPELAEGDFLRWLSRWIGLENTNMYSDDRLKGLMQNAMEMYEILGTREGLVKMIEFHTGVKPVIVEHYEVKAMIEGGKDKKLYERLFGNNPYKFFILLPEHVFHDRGQIRSFMDMIQESVPAHVEGELVLLKPYIFLDRHTYLGINSAIGRAEVMVLGENSTMYFDTIVGGA